ncbi:hypothetical protein ES288_D12G211700v1 [Gossypium darwinii]|uniref:Uncharacterized protein n=1 Tax=Gossypium darwinii TaxID=34276 RepID=A0A5D2AAL8_GOSDA|nr:hypothetical protein ES288_D12G211700v1 [Gossypium darwinii]
MFGSREYPIMGFLFPSLFPLHRLPIRCHINPILPSQIPTSKTLKQQPFLASFDSDIPPLHPKWLGTRENQTTNRLGKGLSGPLLVQRVRRRYAEIVQYNNIKFQVWDLGMPITTS